MATVVIQKEWNSFYQDAFEEPDAGLRRSAIQDAVNAIATRLRELGSLTVEHHDLYRAPKDLHVLRTTFLPGGATATRS